MEQEWFNIPVTENFDWRLAPIGVARATWKGPNLVVEMILTPEASERFFPRDQMAYSIGASYIPSRESQG
jgi:hypothetical protein